MNQDILSKNNELNLIKDYSWFQETVKDSLKSIESNYLKLGYLLSHAKDNLIYNLAGYSDIYDYALNEYSLSSTTVKRLIAIYNRFCNQVDLHNSKYFWPELKEEYKNFGFSQLVELLSIPENELELYSPEMTVAMIRSVKKEKTVLNELLDTIRLKDACVLSSENDGNVIKEIIEHIHAFEKNNIKFVVNIDEKEIEKSFLFDANFKLGTYNTFDFRVAVESSISVDFLNMLKGKLFEFTVAIYNALYFRFDKRFWELNMSSVSETKFINLAELDKILSDWVDALLNLYEKQQEKSATSHQEKKEEIVFVVEEEEEKNELVSLAEIMDLKESDRAEWHSFLLRIEELFPGTFDLETKVFEGECFDSFSYHLENNIVFFNDLDSINYFCSVKTDDESLQFDLEKEIYAIFSNYFKKLKEVKK